jgi:hypothetical protein
MNPDYKEWLNKRFDRDHLSQWLKSGVPLSVHTSNGWYGQLERMERFKNRAQNTTNEDDSLDFSFAFFQACYHLRDWIPMFEKIPNQVWNKKWSNFMNKYPVMKYCRDLCNITKHMTINNASITTNVVITRDFIEDGSELGEFKGWTLHIDNKELDFFELMNECESAWKNFIKDDVFDLLIVSQFLEKE